MIHILSTQLLPESLIQQALESDFKIDCVPFIQTIPIRENALHKTVQLLSHQSITTIFTSSNAVTAVAAMLPAVPLWEIFCIQGSTASSVQKHFPQSVIKGTAAYAKDLVQEIVRQSTTKEVVFFCGNKRLNTLPTLLAAYEYTLKELIVYNTQLTPSKIEIQYNAILFYSPSAVDSFFSANEIDKNIALFSIGATTTGAIEKYGSYKVYTSPQASPRSMIGLLKEKLVCN